MENYDYIGKNLLDLNAKIAEICKNVDRNPEDIKIIAVSKMFPVDAILTAAKFNQIDFGENKVQELIEKQNGMEGIKLNWHLIGHLQTNKVKFVVPFVHLIHSIDSLKLALKIQNEASKLNRIVNCLIQANTSGEEQKSGIDLSSVLNLIKEISVLENIKILGLMTMAKFIDDYSDKEQRKVINNNFRALKNVFDEIKSLEMPNVEMKYLSMGMTSDYDIAIEEGSNMLRIGTAIFGNRKY